MPSLLMQDFAAILRSAIAKSGKSQRELSAQSGVPQPMISRLLNGKTVTLETAGPLADALGLELRPRVPRKRRVDGC